MAPIPLNAKTTNLNVVLALRSKAGDQVIVTPKATCAVEVSLAGQRTTRLLAVDLTIKAPMSRNSRATR